MPTVGAGEVLVKVAGNGLCHSDVGMMEAGAVAPPFPSWQLPFTLGHEIAGWVEADRRGRERLLARAAGDPGGDALGWHLRVLPRGTGQQLRRGQRRARLRARWRPCALTCTCRAPARSSRSRILDPRTAGPLADAAATSMHAVRRVLPRLASGSSAVVIGAGGLGSFAVQLLRALTAGTGDRRGCESRAPGLRAPARGARDAATASARGTAEDLRSLTGGRGAEAVLDFVGIDATITAGLAAVRRTGAYGLIGAGMGRLQHAVVSPAAQGRRGLQLHRQHASRTCARW